jgi:hypothetical protein
MHPYFDGKSKLRRPIQGYLLKTLIGHTFEIKKLEL